MKPKSGIAGDERNIAVLLFLYVLQVRDKSVWLFNVGHKLKKL